MTPELLTAAATLYAAFGRTGGNYTHRSAVYDVRSLQQAFYEAEAMLDEKLVGAMAVTDGEPTPPREA